VSSTAGIVVGQRVTSAIAGLRIPTKVLAVGGALPAGVVELDGPLLYTMPSGTTVTFSNTTLTVASVTGVSAGQLASCAGLPTAIPSTTTVESVNIGANTITLNNGIAAAMPSTTVVAFAAISSNLYLKGQDTVVLNSTDDYATFLWNSTLGRAEFVGSNNDAFTSLNIDQGVTTDYNPILFATSTWNNASTIFFGIELDIIDQASDPTSRLMGFYVGPDEPGLTEVFAVHKNGSVSVGAGGSISVGIDVRKDITGAASAYGVFVRGEIQPDVTNLASCFTTQPTVAPGATFTSFTHFYAFQGLISQDANVQNQYGVLVAANLIDASVLNVGLSSALPIGSPGAVTVNITAMSYSGGTVTATTASPHGVLVGQLFRVDGSVAATIPAGYNGNHVATAGTTGSTLKWAAAADPGAIVGGAYGQSKAVGTYNLYCPGTAFNLVFGPFGVGSANLSGYSFRSNLDMTGGGTVFTRAIAASGTIQSDITGTAAYFEAALGTAAAAFTVGSIYAYQAYIRVGGIGAGSSITNLFGFYANSTMAPVSGVTNSYAFYGQYPVQANTYNLYMAGTAFNYLGGPLGLGTTVLTGYAFRNTLAGANSFTGDLTIYAATVVPAGGSIGVGYKISSTTNLGWFVGSGPPTLSAAKGSVYSNTTAITTTSRVYVNIDGGTTWANFTASA
jgi:hypothetical protein